MPRITYVEHAGTRYEVAAEEGISVMEAAVKNGVPGIVAECGGACACGTCHVYVADSWIDLVAPPQIMERDMLEAVEDLRPNSRLSCQIPITAALDGLVVDLPTQQYLV